MIEDTPEEEIFDIGAIELAATLQDAHQEGNYLVGTTEKGIRFRHRIPHGKMLSKNTKGEFILIDLVTV